MKIKIKDIEICGKCTVKQCSFKNLANIKHDFHNISSETTICPTGAISGYGPSEKSLETGVIVAEKGTFCVECGLCVRFCSHKNLSYYDCPSDTSGFGDLTAPQIKAVTSLYLSALLEFSANTNRNNSLSFDGYVCSSEGREAFVEIDYNNDSLECVRRLLGDIIKYSDSHRIRTGIVVLSELPHKGSRDVYNLISKLRTFPTTTDIQVYMTTFSVLRKMCLTLPSKGYLFDDIFYNPNNEEVEMYLSRIGILLEAGSNA